MPPPQNANHNAGQAWAGFVWDLRLELRARLPQPEADDLAHRVVLSALIGNAASSPAAVQSVLVADDDDGDFYNGTPHSDTIHPGN